MNGRYVSILIILLMVFINSCEKPISACGCDDPKNELEWLSNTLTKYLIVDVYVYYYKDEDYIGISNEGIQTDPLDILINFYNCDGNLVCSQSIYHPPCEIEGSPRNYLFSYKNPIIND